MQSISHGVQTSSPAQAIDARRDARPGVPEERDPSPVGNAHWEEPAQQVATTEVIKDAQRPALTATFGTGPEPRGLSGIMRRAAYKIPDYRAKRWLLLLIADRIDAIESRFLPNPMRE